MDRRERDNAHVYCCHSVLRLAHTGDHGAQEFNSLSQDKEEFGQMLAKAVPLSIADGLAAVAYVHQHASDWGVPEDRVGIIGFSAGGTVAAAVGLRYAPEGRPAFVAAIYPAASMFKEAPVSVDAPPMFLAVATDDQLGLTMDSVGLYQHWVARFARMAEEPVSETRPTSSVKASR